MKTPEEIKEQMIELYKLLPLKDKMQMGIVLHTLAGNDWRASIPIFRDCVALDSHEVGINMDRKPDKRIEELKKDWEEK